MSSSILMTFWMTARRPVMMLTLSYHYKISQVTTQSIMATRPLTDEKTILTLKIKQAYSQWSTQQINSKRDKIWTDICENLKTHSKRRIIIAKYDTHIADLDNRINARKAKLSKIWGGLNMIPANTVQNRDANPMPEVTNVHEWNLSPWIPANQKRNEKVREEDDA
eukprot:219057_1